MKLYDVPRNSFIKIIDDEVKLPIGNHHDKENGNILFFDHIDGMYSLCNDVLNNYIHLVAWTEVEISSEEEFLNQLKDA